MWKILIFIIFLAFIALALIITFWYKKRLTNSGKMIKREKGFEENGEIFTLCPISEQQFIDAINAEDFYNTLGCKVNGDYKKITFERNIYIANLVLLEQTEEKSVYRFDFTRWRTDNGDTSFWDLNILLTQIENMFLKLDPHTQISIVKNESKKRSLF